MEPAHAPGLRSIDEEFADVALSVDGDLPDWLAGTLFRNGPGKFSVDGRGLRHWFDGLAYLRRFEIDGAGNEVRFDARFLRSEEFESVDRRGRLRHGQFGTSAGLLAHLRDLLRGAFTDNASIGVDHDADLGAGEGSPDGETHPTDLAAITETPRGIAFDPEDLTTRGGVGRDAGLDVTGVLGHPHEDPDGTLVNVGTDIGRESAYVLYEQPRGKPAREIARRPVDRPAYVHSFAVTSRYAVLFESPFRLDPGSLLRPDPFVEAFEWKTGRKSRFVVFDRETGTVVATPTAAPAFVYHHANAFVDGDELVVDAVAYPDATTIRTLYLDNLRSPEPSLETGELRRYRLPLSGTVASEHTLHPGPVEFPTTNYARVNGRPYRHLYAVGNEHAPPRELQNRLVKVDAEDGTEAAAWSEPATFTGEPLFVPREPPAADPLAGGPDGASGATEEGTAVDEDDGVLLTVVLDADAEASVLLVLDATALTELARVPLPAALPFGFHGQFYRAEGPKRRSMA